MRFLFIVSIVVFLFPTGVWAAGFAKQSLFLSQSSVAAGQTVFIYATVTNDTEKQFTGELRFLEAASLVGTAAVSLKAGQAATVSVSWTPTEGQHTIEADLFTQEGEKTESQESIFFVNPASGSATSAAPTDVPKTNAPEAQKATNMEVLETSDPIVQTLSPIAPGFTKNIKQFFAAIDAARFSAAQRLIAGTEWAKKNISVAATASSSYQNTLWLVATTMVLYVCSSANYLLSSFSLFYATCALLFLFVLWRIYRLFRG